MSADWYPGIRAFCGHWKQAPMLQQTFETLEREFADENDACIDAAKGLVECACRVLIEELDDPLSPVKPEATDPPLGHLVGLATRLLDLGAARDRAFSDLIKQHNKLTETLRVLRNEAGTVSHGRMALSPSFPPTIGARPCLPQMPSSPFCTNLTSNANPTPVGRLSRTSGSSLRTR